LSASSDTELVNAFLHEGQDAAYVELIRRHQIPIYRRLAVELADPDDAEAVCEAAFVVASQRLAEWPRDIELRDWLLALASEVGAARHGETVDTESPRLVDPAVYFRQSVHRALHTLDPEDRAVLLAVDLEGQTPEQVAADRGISLGRVTESLERARLSFTETISQGPEAAAAPSAQAPVRVEPGEIIDNRYRVEELLGEGGMATVFRAEHVGIKRKVALKTLRPTRQTQAMIRERFIREAEVLGRLAHPNFVDVSDSGESARGLAYLVMELLQGRPLSSELHERGKLHPHRALSVLREVARGLEFAHGLGIIHRDIKPDNVVVLDDESQEGFAKILDLGVAATSDEHQSGEAVLFGTPEYMAPEQIQGGRIDGRVDLYAVGIMLFELLTGEVPFHGGSVEFVLARQLTSAPPRLEDVSEGLLEVEALQSLLDRCLAKDPAQRIKSASALKREIEALLDRLGPAPSEAGTSRRQPRTMPVPTAGDAAESKRAWSRSRTVVFLLLALAGLALAAWWWIHAAT
jgi:DNA-directed RNA polymerase specialized sigma24 family protein/tRNA A-37 threonylcarbamoyl transferase component Bud32